MKKIILMVVALLLLSGGGFAAYTFFGGKTAEASLTDGEKKSQQTQADEAKKKAEENAKASFVKIDPLTLPVIDKTGIVQIINISITLEIEDPEKAKEIEKFTPRLKDAYIQEMYGTLSNKVAMDKNGIVDVGVIKDRLHKITIKVLGEDGGVKDVLLQAVQQRKA